MLSWIVTSCVLILAVILIRRAFRGKASARAIYALWLFVALRLLVPGSISMDAPVPAVAEVVNRAPVVQLSERLDGAQSAEFKPSGEVEAQFESSGPVVVAENVTQREFDLAGVLVKAKALVRPLWLAGVGATLLVFAASWIVFSRRVRRSREFIDVPGAPVRVFISDAVDTPCLFGLFSPAVYIPASVAADAGLMRHALAHEFTHYSQHDHVWCILRCACLALHWYNPLVWLSSKLSRRDCELSCDEATIARLGEDERTGYGRSLIKLTCESPRGSAVATTMCAGAKELKDRIKMLTKRKHSIIALSLAAVLAFTATACSFVSSATEPTPIPGSNPGRIEHRRDGSETYDFTAPGGAEGVRISAWTFDGTRWVEQPQTDMDCSAETGVLSFNVSTVSNTYSYLLELTDRNSVSVSDKSLGALAGDEGVDFRSTLFDCGPMECAVNETVPLVLVSTVSGADISYFTNPAEIEDRSAKYVCFTITFTAVDGSILLRGQDESVDPPYQAVYDFTAPEGAGRIQVNFYRLNNGAVELCSAMEYPLDTEEGALTIGYEDDIKLDVTYSDGTGSSVEGISLEDITQTDNRSWGVKFQQGREFAILGDEVPLMMFSSGSTGVNWDAYYAPSNYAGSDVSVVFVTATFIGSSGQSDGHIAQLERDDGNGTATFDYIAPSGARSIRFTVYRYDRDTGTWDSRMVSDRACKTDEGKLVFTFDRLERAFGFGVEYLDGTGSSVDGLSLDELAMTSAQNVEDWGKSVPIGLNGFNVGLNTELPVVFYIGVVGGAGTCSMDYFEHPENIEGDDEYICVTVEFTTAENPPAEPDPITQPTVQSAEMVGFKCAYVHGGSYEDIASAWVHDYAYNLTRLPESDGASCENVDIETCEVLAASVTHPERLIVRMTLNCYPVNTSAFELTFGMTYPVESAIDGQGQYYQRGRTLVLEDRGVWECVSASTDEPDRWGYQTLEHYDDEDYIVKMADAGMSDERIVSLVNYNELNEASGKSWHQLVQILDRVSIAPEGSDDQLVRDMYTMLAVKYADGAYSVWLGNIYRAQREHDPDTFAAALLAFDSETQEHITHLADTPL